MENELTIKNSIIFDSDLYIKLEKIAEDFISSFKEECYFAKNCDFEKIYKKNIKEILNAKNKEVNFFEIESYNSNVILGRAFFISKKIDKDLLFLKIKLYKCIYEFMHYNILIVLDD